MDLCECDCPKRVEQIGVWDGCPLEGFAHTSFIVQRCKSCGKIDGFPRANLDLAINKGTEETKQMIAHIIQENNQTSFCPDCGATMDEDGCLFCGGSLDEGW